MAAWGYEFYLHVLKVSLIRSLRSFVREDKIHIPVTQCNILYIHWKIQLILISSLSYDTYGRARAFIAKLIVITLIFCFCKLQLCTVNVT